MLSMLDVVDLTEELVAIPSVSGNEAEVVEYVKGLLESRGWSVQCQEVAPGRENVWASRGSGVVTLSTHLDTVGPFIAPSRKYGRLYGRGTCDAKGIAASMICAAQRLADVGEERIDLLFVVGEEAGSDGAMAANELPSTSSALINGEPTEGRLASGAKGSLRVLVRTEGKAAHSAYPDEGDSAITAMVGLLSELDHLSWPTDHDIGETTVNIGRIIGGEAANIVPAQCEAELLVRLVGEPGPVQRILDHWAEGRASLLYGAQVPTTRFRTVPGFDIEAVSFTTDAPLLSNWGEALLFGPGSIHYAHGVDEHIEIDELRQSVTTYERLVLSLLEGY
jgi:acetylornithine deacetylase